MESKWREGLKLVYVKQGSTVKCFLAIKVDYKKNVWWKNI